MKLTLIRFLTERLRNKFANAKNTHCAPMVPLLVPKLANSLITNASYLSLGSANKTGDFSNRLFLVRKLYVISRRDPGASIHGNKRAIVGVGTPEFLQPTASRSARRAAALRRTRCAPSARHEKRSGEVSRRS